MSSWQCFGQSDEENLQAPAIFNEAALSKLNPSLPSTSGNSVSEPATAEILRAKPPEGWKLSYQFNNDDMRLADFIPAEKDVKAWRTKV